MIRRYYEDELHYLYEAGKEFARAHPEEARYLNIESVADRDPYVERLFEGFAFLTGRIRERLDDELPELTEALFNLLWPHFLKPIPSLSILEFTPRPGLVQKTTVFPAGTEVRSAPVGDESAICRFRTTQDVRLQPMSLKDVTLNWPPGGTTVATLRFTLEKGIEYQQLQLNPLRLYFQAEDTVASMMHLFFTQHVDHITISAGGAAVEINGHRSVTPAGLAANEGLLPYSRYSFTGIRLLQEYLAFRRKFWFVDITGFDLLSPPPKTTEFEVKIFFDRAYPEEKRFKGENVRLFCAPIVNLFRGDAEPIRLDHLLSEYRVTPDVRHPRSVEVYSVDTVAGTEDVTGDRHTYRPFYSFRHGNGGESRHYTTLVRPGPSDNHIAYISVGGLTMDRGDLPIETLSLEITCTNGTLPREKLQERMINQPAPDFSNVAAFENLTQPTLDLHPLGSEALRSGERLDNFLWKLISHLSFNFMSVASLESLRGLLDLYDWTGTDANKRRIAGIRDVRWVPKEIISRGAVLRGAEVTIEIQDGHFADEGDLCLFGLVMSNFFSMYASINSFVHLNIVTKPSEQHYHWQPAKGMLPVI